LLAGRRRSNNDAANKWSAGVFHGLPISDLKDLAMRAFLQFDRKKGGGFVSMLCSGLLVASLALASPAFAAGGGGGGGGAGGGGASAGGGGAVHRMNHTGHGLGHQASQVSH
jgi:tetratricopeptide (TPR) repeat protein